MAKDKIIQQNCKLLLTKSPALRNPILKKQRIWAYWRMFDELGGFGVATEEQFLNLTDGETISRAFRAIQQENKELRASTQLHQKSAEMAEKHRLSYANKTQNKN